MLHRQEADFGGAILAYTFLKFGRAWSEKPRKAIHKSILVIHGYQNTSTCTSLHSFRRANNFVSTSTRAQRIYEYNLTLEIDSRLYPFLNTCIVENILIALNSFILNFFQGFFLHMDISLERSMWSMF